MMPEIRLSRLWNVKPELNELVSFATLNAEPLAQLRTFLDFAEGFTIALVEVEFRQDAELLWSLLRENPGADDIELIGLWLGDPDLKFLRDELMACLEIIEREPGKRLALIVGGLEQSIKIQGTQQPLLKDLNFMRDSYRESVPHPLVLVLPRGAMERLAEFTPDFWAWQSGLFVFASLPGREKQLQKELSELSGYIQNDRAEVRASRIDTLQRLRAQTQWTAALKMSFRKAL